MNPASRNALVAEVHRLVRLRGGRLPFDQFLELVMYHPTLGYYGRKNIFGRDGDYQTAPRVHPIFGWTVAKVIEEEWRRQGRPDGFTILELGPGECHLMRSVLNYLVNERGFDLGGWRIMLLDRFPRRYALTTPDGMRKPRWLSSLKQGRPFNGVMIANELLDAIPFHRLTIQEGRWKELYVGEDDASDDLTWVVGPLSGAHLADGLGKDIPEGTTIEVAAGLHPLFRDLAGVLAEGIAIFLDYGDTRENLLLRHPEGTLQTFSQHSAGIDPFLDLGSRDITAWVDFTRVMDETKKAGFVTEEFLTQAEALYRWGIQDIVLEATRKGGEVEGVKAHLASKTFLFSYTNHHALKLRRFRRARAAPLRSLTR
jgi:SAM-dependent MidA family methyltransferase